MIWDNTVPPSTLPSTPPGPRPWQRNAHSVKKKSAACRKHAPETSNTTNPRISRGHRRLSKTLFISPNHSKATGIKQAAAPNSRICANPSTPPTGPMKLAPDLPDLSANGSSNPQRGRSAGLYDTSASSSTSPHPMRMIPMSSLDHLPGSGNAPRFLLSLLPMAGFRVTMPDFSAQARLFS